MQFSPVPLEDALGTILAHSVDLPSGKLRKGRVIDANDVSLLRAAGRASVIVARLAADDVHEDDAATRIGAALVPDPTQQGLRLSVAATGRVNLHATAAGVVVLNTAAIHALNRVNPMITLATVPAFQRIEAGGMVATVKIIAYGVPGVDVARACAAASAALGLATPVVRSAQLIETSIGTSAPSSKGREALRSRLARLGVELREHIVVGHATAALAQALRVATADMIFLLTASATSDSHDVAPEGLREAGGSVAHFGMPVDPGNLLFFGSLGTRPVIGLPGCARSPALNGADWVMERLICGLRLTSDDIAEMGVGGLLKEIPTRPRPREA